MFCDPNLLNKFTYYKKDKNMGTFDEIEAE